MWPAKRGCAMSRRVLLLPLTGHMEPELAARDFVPPPLPFPLCPPQHSLFLCTCVAKPIAIQQKLQATNPMILLSS